MKHRLVITNSVWNKNPKVKFKAWREQTRALQKLNRIRCHERMNIFCWPVTAPVVMRCPLTIFHFNLLKISRPIYNNFSFKHLHDKRNLYYKIYDFRALIDRAKYANKAKVSFLLPFTWGKPIIHAARHLNYKIHCPRVDDPDPETKSIRP